MLKTYVKYLLCIIVCLKFDSGYASQGDSCLVLIVNPIAEILTPLRPTDAIDVQIQFYSERLPKAIYDHLQHSKKVDLRTQFDELMRLRAQIATDNREEFIKGILKLIRYRPDAYLFASIDRATDKVVFRAEIIDLASRSLAVASRRIKFTKFLNDNSVQQEMQKLGNSLLRQIQCNKKNCGTVSLNEYISEHDRYAFGFGLGYRKGDHVTLGNIPRDIRTTPPHPDDLKNRPGDILDPSIPDNYLIRENAVRIDLGYRKNIDAYFSFWEIVNISIRTSTIGESGEVYDQNLFRKNYIKPEIPGEALIYYSVKSKSRQFFERSSFSLPIFVTYPVFYCGKNEKLIFRIMGGTNILFPEKIELEAEQGWDRFGAQEVLRIHDMGKLKEIEWFGGIDIEWSPVESYRFGIQPAFVYTDYHKDLKFPLFLYLENNIRFSLRVNITKSLEF